MEEGELLEVGALDEDMFESEKCEVGDVFERVWIASRDASIT